MNKKMKIPAVLSVLLTFITAHAQEEGIQLKDLEMPSAPALALLDLTSTTIETPKNVQALTISLLNNANTNFGVEMSPYMMFSDSRNFYSHYNFRPDPQNPSNLIYNGWFTSAFKNLTVSLAKAGEDDIESVSIGVRTNLITLVTQDYVDAFNALNATYTAYQIDHAGTSYEISEFYRMKNNVSTLAYEAILTLSDGNLAAVDVAWQAVPPAMDVIIASGISQNDYDYLSTANPGLLFSDISRIYRTGKTLAGLDNEALEAYYEEAEDLSANKPKPVFVFDVAGGYSHFFDSKQFSGGQSGKIGGWATLNGNFRLQRDDNTKYLSLYLYARYLSDRTIPDAAATGFVSEEYFDLGGKAAFEYRKLSFAYEYIHRTKDKDNYRSVGSVSYKFNDHISLNGGFGKNFEKADNLVTFLGVSWGIASGNQSAN